MANVPPTLLKDGSSWNQVNGDNVKITRKDGNIFVNDAKIVAAIQGSNGIVYVIDKVLLPPSK